MGWFGWHRCQPVGDKPRNYEFGVIAGRTSVYLRMARDVFPEAAAAEYATGYVGQRGVTVMSYSQNALDPAMEPIRQYWITSLGRIGGWPYAEWVGGWIKESGTDYADIVRKLIRMNTSPGHFVEGAPRIEAYL